MSAWGVCTQSGNFDLAWMCLGNFMTAGSESCIKRNYDLTHDGFKTCYKMMPVFPLAVVAFALRANANKNAIGINRKIEGVNHVWRVAGGAATFALALFAGVHYGIQVTGSNDAQGPIVPCRDVYLDLSASDSATNITGLDKCILPLSYECRSANLNYETPYASRQTSVAALMFSLAVGFFTLGASSLIDEFSLFNRCTRFPCQKVTSDVVSEVYVDRSGNPLEVVSRAEYDEIPDNDVVVSPVVRLPWWKNCPKIARISAGILMLGAAGLQAWASYDFFTNCGLPSALQSSSSRCGL
jgi:hypothetical protein